MGIFDKIKKFGEQLEKKIENADDSIKKIDENLSNKDSVPTRDDIFTGMILYPKKKKNGKLVKAFSKDGQDFTSLVSTTRLSVAEPPHISFALWNALKYSSIWCGKEQYFDTDLSSSSGYGMSICLSQVLAPFA